MKKVSTICIGFLIAVIANAQRQGDRKYETVLEGGVKIDATFLNFQMTGASEAVSSLARNPPGTWNLILTSSRQSLDGQIIAEKCRVSA